MLDFNVDGSFISAESAEDARDEFKALYGVPPVEVRPWTAEDQEELDAQ